MEFSRPNTGVGCHSLLQGTFPTQGSNPGLPHCRQILYQLSHSGSEEQVVSPYFKNGKIEPRKAEGLGCPSYVPPPGAIGLGVSPPGAQFCDLQHVASDHSVLLCLLLTNGENQDSLWNLLGLVQNVKGHLVTTYYDLGTSLMVQWLRIHLAMQRIRVQSLVGELRSHMPQSN